MTAPTTTAPTTGQTGSAEVAALWREADMAWQAAHGSYIDTLLMCILRTLIPRHMSTYYPSDHYYRASDLVKRLETVTVDDAV